MIRHEEGVELPGLQFLRQPGDMLEVEVGIRKGTGVAPPRGVDTDGAHERTEMKLASIGHRGSPAICVGTDCSALARLRKIGDAGWTRHNRLADGRTDAGDQAYWSRKAP